jgi:hypothetical protein
MGGQWMLLALLNIARVDLRASSKNGKGVKKMKNLVAVATVLALAFAGQCFAEDLDSKHDCIEHGGQMNSAGQCMKDGAVIATSTAAVASPAVAAGASAGAVSAGTIAGVAAVAGLAIAIGVSGGGGNGTNHGTTGTTGTH